MGKGSPSAPPAPDPAATAAAQAAANRDTALTQAGINRVNQVTPTGSQTWTSSPVQWTESQYLAANPDVARAVQSGQFGSGLEHYRQHGLAEGRTGAPAGYDPWSGGSWTLTTSLSPDQQRLLDLSERAQITYGEAANSQLDQVRDTLSRPFDPSGLPAMNGSVQDRTGQMVTGVQNRTGEVQRDLDFSRYGDPNISRDRVEQALMSRLRPQLDQTRVGLETRLRNQGLTPGTEAWNTAMRDAGQQENDALMAAVLSAGQEQNRLQALGLNDAQFRNAATGQAQDMDLQRAGFANATAGQMANMDLARAGFGNNARQQALAEALQLRAQPINEASALLTGQMISPPQFQGVPQVSVAPTDYLGAVGMNQAAQNQAYQGRVAAQQGNNAAAAGAATAVATTAAAIIA